MDTTMFSNIDIEGLKNDVKEIEKNPDQAGEYKDLPDGKYIVKIEKLELIASKKGLPMVTCWMKVIEGEDSGSMLFYNQVIHAAFGLHKANEFLKALGSTLDITFESFDQYNNLILDIYETVTENYEYQVECTTNKKGFKVYEVLEVYSK